MKTRNLWFVVLVVILISACRQSIKTDDEVYLFSHFINNGQDGLHLLYSTDGFKWEALNNGDSLLAPEISNDKLMRDPCIIEDEEGTFHMVWTVSWNEKGIGYAHSKNLINWSEQQYLPVMEHEEGARNCWAPEITYDKTSKTFMIYWATTITGMYPETQTNEESGYNHRMYYVTTKDFKTYSETKLLYEPGFNVIDASIQPYKGKFVMFLKDETRVPPKKTLHVAFADKLTGPYGKPGEAITGNYWAEGPTALFINGKWIVYFDKYRNHQMGAVMSEDLVNWTDISDSVSFPAGTRHGTAFKVKQKVLDNLLQQTAQQ